MPNPKTVAIKHPDVPGEFCIINETDFREGVHELWKGALPEAPATPEPTPAPTPAPKGGAEEPKADGKDKKTPAADVDLPDGYVIEEAGEGGGYFFLYAPSGALIAGPDNEKFHGRDDAILAALEHAEK